MSDTPWNDAAGEVTMPPTAARPPRQKRQARAAAEPKPRKPQKVRLDASELPIAKTPRKPREPKAEKAVTNTVRVDIKQYASMTCGLDAGVFVKVHGLLAGLAKGARNKVLGELAKVFG